MRRSPPCGGRWRWSLKGRSRRPRPWSAAWRPERMLQSNRRSQERPEANRAGWRRDGMRTIGVVTAAVAILGFSPGGGVALAGGDAAKGKVAFQQYCAGCHGPTGKGDGAAGAAMNPKPKDLWNQA